MDVFPIKIYPLMPINGMTTEINNDKIIIVHYLPDDNIVTRLASYRSPRSLQ